MILSTGRLPLVLGLFCLVLAGASNMFLGAVGSTVERELGLSHTLFGALQGGLFLGNVIGSLLFDWWQTRFRLKHLGLISLVLFGGNLMSGIPTFFTLLCGRTLLGLGFGFGICFVGTLITQCFSSHRGGLFSLLHGAMAGGSMCGMLAAGLLIQLAGGWARVPWLLAGSLFPMVLLLLWIAVPDMTEKASHGRLRTAVLHPAILNSSLFLFGYIAIEIAVLLFLPIFLQSLPALQGATEASVTLLAGRVTAAFMAGIVVGRFLIPLLPPRWMSIGQVMTLALVSTALIVGVLVVPLSLTGLVVALFLAGALIGPTVPLVVAQVSRCMPGRQLSAVSLTNVILCMGGVVGTPVVGLLADQIGLRTSILASAFLFIVGSVFLLRLRHGQKSPGER